MRKRATDRQTGTERERGGRRRERERNPDRQRGSQTHTQRERDGDVRNGTEEKVFQEEKGFQGRFERPDKQTFTRHAHLLIQHQVSRKACFFLASCPGDG